MVTYECDYKWHYWISDGYTIQYLMDMTAILLDVAKEQGYAFLCADVYGGVHERDTGYEDFSARYGSYEDFLHLPEDFSEAEDKLLDGEWYTTLNFDTLQVHVKHKTNGSITSFRFYRDTITMPDSFLAPFLAAGEKGKKADSTPAATDSTTVPAPTDSVPQPTVPEPEPVAPTGTEAILQKIDLLNKLKDLMAAGVLTAEEFRDKAQQFLHDA